MPRAYRSKHVDLKSVILENEQLKGTAVYKTVSQLAEEYECGTDTIYQLRHRLHLRSTNLALRHVNNPSMLPSATTTDGLLRILEDEPLLTATDRLKILSRLIRTGAPQVKITAIKTFEDLTRQTVERVGPPVPLNAEEASARLARLMMGVGRKITDMAYDTAYGEHDEIQGPEAPVQPEPTTPQVDASPPALPLPDLPPEAESPVS